MCLKDFFKKKNTSHKEKGVSKIGQYYFYIGKKLVTELLACTKYNGQFEEYNFKEEKKDRASEKRNSKASIKAISAGSDISYGQENTLVFNKKSHTNYVKKLEFLLNSPEYSNQFQTVFNGESKDLPQYFRYIGRFKISEPITDITNDTIITINSQTEKSNYNISVDCSIVNFSEFIEGSDNTVQNIVHSGNKAFFDGELEIHAEGLLKLLGVKDNTIYARAIYLKSLNNEVQL